MKDDTHILRVEDCDKRPGAREIDSALVAQIVVGMQALGFMDSKPVTVRRSGNRYIIMDGQHRIEAARTLGIEEVPAVIEDISDAAALTHEGVANLHRPDTEAEKWSRAQEFLDLADAGVPVDPAQVYAATGLDAEQQEVVRRVRKKVADPVAMVDQGSYERIEALDEFADDADAYARLLNASEKDWRGIAATLRRERKTAEAYAQAVATVEAYGVELLPKRVYDRHQIGTGTAMPEGAVAAAITTYDWNGAADIVWYGAVGESDPEAAAEREQQQAKHAELEDCSMARLTFISERLAMANALRDLASDAWHNTGAFKRPANSYGMGIVSSARHLEGTPFEDAHGLATRMTAAVMVAVEHKASQALTNDWQQAELGKGALAYFDALASIGYEPSEVEAAAIAELTTAMKPKRKAKKESAE